MTARPGQTRVLICGGGGAVDALRRIDAANPVSAEAAHWAAIAMMDAGALLLSDWLPNFEVRDRVPTEPGDWILQCGRLLREDEPYASGERLAIGWQTTSDAIAARIAVLTEADLLLLKHTLKRTYDSLPEAVAEGVIDAETPRVAASLASARLLGVISPCLPHPFR
jgi:aspartokinase-like uncharacterized kinase